MFYEHLLLCVEQREQETSKKAVLGITYILEAGIEEKNSLFLSIYIFSIFSLGSSLSSYSANKFHKF
jgi:hypothetical protein